MALLRDPSAPLHKTWETKPAASAPRTMAFADLATPDEVKIAAPWAKAVIKIEAGPCQGTFLAFECLEEATAWTDRQGARD